MSVVVGEPLSSTEKIRSVAAVVEGSALLVGTNTGTCYLYALESHEGHQFVPVWGSRLHGGPVYDIACSDALYAVTGGHDGTCCVVGFDALFRRQGGGKADTRAPSSSFSFATAREAAVLRYADHTMPVVAVRCFSDGRTFVSLSVDGVVAVRRVCATTARDGTPRDAPLLKVSCGFPAKCLTLSIDETLCFVGGKKLVSLDLYAARRPDDAMLSAQAEGSAQTAVKCNFLTWQAEGGAACGETKAEDLIHSLQVEPADGSLRAVFSTARPSDAAPHLYAEAHWVTITAPAVLGPCTADRELYPEWLHHAQLQTAPRAATVTLAAERHKPLHQVETDYASYTALLENDYDTAFFSLEESLVAAKKKREGLQRECDLLVLELKKLLQAKQKGPQKKRARGSVE